MKQFVCLFNYAINYSARMQFAIGDRNFARTYKCDYRLLSNGSKAYNYASTRYRYDSLLNTFHSPPFHANRELYYVFVE